MKLGADAPGLKQLLEDLNSLVGGDRAGHLDRQDLPGELVDDVEDPKPAAVGGLVVLEVERPDVIGSLGLQVLRLGRRMPEPASLLGFVGDLEPFFAPDPLDALAVDRKPVLLRDRVGAAIAEARSLLGEGDQPGSKLLLLVCASAAFFSGSSGAGRRIWQARRSEIPRQSIR